MPPIEIQVGLLVGLFTILGAAVPQCLQNRFRKEERKQIELGKLEGLKILRKQLYLSRFEAFIFSDYHEFRNKLEPNALDFSEAKRWMQKSEDLALEIAKANQSFLESLGIISVLFSCSEELKELIEKNRAFGSPLIKRPNSEMSKQELEQYKAKAMKGLQKLIDKEYGEKVEILIKKLKNNL